MYKGKCHCGKIRFKIKCDLKELKRCDCSHCRRKGYVMTTVNEEEFDLISGKKFLSKYQWNTQIAEHFFCKICGINTHHRRRSNPNVFGVNVGCLESFNSSWIRYNSEFTNGVNFSLEKKEKGDASIFVKK